MRIKFTKSWAEKLVVEKRTRYADEVLPSLTLRVTPTGGKTFYYRARHKERGVVERSIGRFGQWTVDQARRKAAEYAASFNAGIDPDEAAARTAQQSSTLDHVAVQWLFDLKHKVSTGELRHLTWVSYERNYRLHIRPVFGRRKLVDISADAVRDHMRTEQYNQSLHNHWIAVLRGVYRYASDELGIDVAPPVTSVHRREQPKRERYLRPDEVAPLFDSIAQEDQLYQDVVLILLFTAQRKAVVHTMEWSEVDLERNTWTIPGRKMKGRRAHSVPLIEDAVLILRRRKAEAKTGYVFPGMRSPHIPVKTERYWNRIAHRAGLRPADLEARLTIHDLRRTLGSWQAIEGVGLQQIAKVLGHKNINITASTYAHLDAESTRVGIQTAVSAITRASGRESQTDKLGAIMDGLSEAEKAELLERLAGKG
uniref:tyrosine-type recombinase/integrase n=1 Tax=Marinobacterium profundum TaxID=1714300 RepID=UPI00082E6DDE|nr:tyrosine-type recombinase/integrase [Marinobacterium profundum]